jgi:uncharacterized protein YndB with AHSA1/START domain
MIKGSISHARLAMRRILFLSSCLFCYVVLGSPAAFADVVDSAPNGFTLKVVVDAAAPAALVYRALTERIGAWWDSSHSFSGNAANLSIDARPGGCFCETLPGGGGVRHMTVTYADPGKLLRLSGGLGPLQDLAVTGAMTWKLTEASGRTTIEVTYKVGGYVPGGTGVGALAAPVDAVLTAQVKRLAQFVEKSTP